MTHVDTRPVVVVDCETTGLDHTRHIAVEVAWWNLATDERGWFVPPHDWRRAVAEADVEALRINGYIDRIVGQTQDYSGTAASRLHDALSGACLAGSNPAFDAPFLAAMFRARDALWQPPWHHRLGDLAAYAAGALGLPLGSLPGLRAVCDMLGVTYDALHRAEADVTATGQCLMALDMRRVSSPPAPAVPSAAQADWPSP